MAVRQFTRRQFVERHQGSRDSGPFSVHAAVFGMAADLT